MKAHATNADGLRVYDPANLPPIRVLEPRFKEGFAPAKVSLSNPTSSREVILRDKLPENVILFARFLRSLNGGKLDTLHRPTKRHPWQTVVISNLYSRFYKPFHPGRFTLQEYNVFLGLTLPSLVRFMSFESIRCLCLAIHWRHRQILLAAKISREKHRRRCLAVIYNAFIPIPPEHPKITKPLHREAWRIVWALATRRGVDEGHFFLAGRELRDRLFTKDYKTAQRILERFCKLGVIVKTSSGDTKWGALAAGRRPLANGYVLRLELSEKTETQDT
jgi:hypothetical protein